MDRKFLLTRASRIALALLLIPTACSKFTRLSESEKHTAVTIGSNPTSGMTRAYAPQLGGIQVWAVSSTKTNLKTSFFLPTDTAYMNISLPNDDWTFYAMGWTGTGKFQGTMRCGSATATLSGTDTSVSIPIATTGCTDAFFGPAIYTTGTPLQPQALRFISCLSVAGISGPGQNCDNAARGVPRSFAVSLGSYQLTPLNAAPSNVGLTPTPFCVDNPSWGTSGIATGTSWVISSVAIPVGAGAGSPIFTEISGFTGANCSGTELKMNFPFGLYAGPDASTTAKVFDNSFVTDVFLQNGSWNPAPTIASMSTVYQKAGTPFALSILGTYFYNALSVAIGSYSCASVSTVPTTAPFANVSCGAPAMTAGTRYATVTNFDGQTVVSPTPIVSGTWSMDLGLASKLTQGVSAASDSSGNVFMGGFSGGAIDGNSTSANYVAFVTKYDSSGSKQWTKISGGTTSSSTTGTSITTDSTGNVFLGGYSNASVDGQSSFGSNDFFVSKFDTTGTKLWTAQLGVASKNTYGNSLATDSAGNVYVAGSTTGNLDSNTIASGAQGVFVTKYSSTGTKVWTYLGSGASVLSPGQAITIDSSDNIYVTGQTNGNYPQTKIGSMDFFVMKLTTAGSLVWAKQLGVAGGTAVPYGVSTDSSGNVYVAGNTNMGLDGNALSGSSDLFYTVYNSAGTKLYTKQFGSTGANLGVGGLKVDSIGNVYITGVMNGGGSVYDGITVQGTGGLFVTKFDGTQARIFSRGLTVAGSYVVGWGVNTDASGNVVVVGQTSTGLDGNSLTGTQDAILVKYDSSGNRL